MKTPIKKEKTMKKIAILVLVLAIVLGVCQTGFAKDLDLNDEEHEFTTKTYTYDESIEYLQKNLDITYNEAVKLFGPKLDATKSGGYTYGMEFIYYDSFGMGLVEYGSFAIMWTDNQYRQINEIISKWYGAATSGFYIVNNYYHYDDCQEPDWAFTDYGRSQIETVVSYSTQAAMEAGIEIFVDFDFSYTVSAGFTVYFRKTKSSTHYFSIY